MTFEGHGVFGWDARGMCYPIHWFDSQGVEHGAPAFGTWEETVLHTHETTHMGHSRQVYDVEGDRCRFLLQYSRDGREWTTFLESAFRRVAT